MLRDDESFSRHSGSEHDPIPDAISAWLDHGKQSMAVFPESRAVDLLICDSPDFDRNDARAVVCITPFGMAQFARPWSELVVQHASGFAFHQAMPVSDLERLPPRASSDREAFMAAGVAAALASVWAVMMARHTVVDFSVCDYLSHLLIEAVSLGTEPRKPISRHRQPGQAIAIAGGLVWLLPCSDGDVMISPREEHQWRRWVELMGNPGWAEQADICGNRESRTRNTGSHALVENFSAGVLPKYCLGYEDLRAIAPWIIYVSGSGLGRTGPLRDALAYGTLLQAFSGRCALVGTPNPSLEAMGVLPAWTDPVTAFWETLGIAAAISNARRTGRGAYIDLSMLEGTIALIPESLFSAQNLAPPPSPINTERDAAPSGCYRCSDPDGWIALSVRSDAEWSAACMVLGMPTLARDSRYVRAEARLLHRADIDAQFRACLRGMSSTKAEARLRTAGVPASRSRNIFEVVDEKSSSAPGLFPHMAGGRRTIAMPWTDQHGWRGRTDAGPALGEHTDQVLGELLGLDRGEIARLKAAGAVG